MAKESYELSWKEFDQCSSQAFKDHYNSEEYSDVTLASADDKQIKAHKIILSACSPFFQKILRNNPHQNPLIYLKGIKHESIRSILKFMYLGETKVPEEDLKHFLEAADELKVKGLTDTTQPTNIKKELLQTSEQFVSDPSQYGYMNIGKNVVSDFVYIDDNGYNTETLLDANNPYNEVNFLTEFQTITDMDIKSVLDGRKYPCDQCVYKAASKELLMAHITSIHGEVLSNYSVVQPTKLAGTSRTKQKKKNFTVRCNLCSMLLLNEENSLLDHVKNMHGA